MIQEGETLENKPNSAAEGTRPRIRQDLKHYGVRSNDKFGAGSSMRSTAFTQGNPLSVQKNRRMPQTRGQSIPGMGHSKQPRAYMPLRDQGRIGGIAVKAKEPSINHDTNRGKKPYNSVTGFNREKAKSMGRKDDLPDLKKPV